MSVTGAYPRLVDAMDEIRRGWRQQQLLHGGLLAAGAGLAVLVLLVAADNLLAFGVPGRVVMAVMLWGSLGLLVTGLVVRRWIEERRDDYYAALLEQRFPELDNRIINALQLGRGTEPGSPQIVQAIVADANDISADLELSDCLDWNPVQRVLMFAGAVLLVLLAYGSLAGARFANGLQRVLLPVAQIEPYTATVINEATIKYSKKVPEGGSVSFSVAVGGNVIPDTARIRYRSDQNAPWAILPMKAGRQPQGASQRTFKATLENVTRSFVFSVVAGDDRSGMYKVAVDRLPRISGLTVTVEPPRYAGTEPQETTGIGGEVEGLAGSTVTLRVTASEALNEATLETESGQSITLTGEGETWSTSFVIWSEQVRADSGIEGRRINSGDSYRLKLIDTGGYENADPVWRSVAAVPDREPSVTIPEPGADRQVKPDAVVPLTVDARDDYGLGRVAVLYRVNDQGDPKLLVQFNHADGAPSRHEQDPFEWNLAESGIVAGDLVRFWAQATDRNNVTGPGQAVSRRYTIFVITPEQIKAGLAFDIEALAAFLEQLIRLQAENRAETTAGVEFKGLVAREIRIRNATRKLAVQIKEKSLPLNTMVIELNELASGPMADAVTLFESGNRTDNDAHAAKVRTDSLPIQDAIIKKLQELLARLERAQQARKELRRIKKKDQVAHKAITSALETLVGDLERLHADETELASKLEKMPKKPVDEYSEEELDALKEFDDLVAKWNKWKKGTVNELTKLPTGFIKDFGLREDVTRVFEEVEAVATRPKTTSLEVPLEELGSSKATEMLEDLEIWMPDAPDALKWLLEEPLAPLKMPEMPLPDALRDLIGELLQEAEDFEEEADDITSAWGDNLNQAGWGVSDGPISNFSAKGVTGNDLPNNMEVSGRAGDGRRGKSSGQMVGDTARGLDGRKTPARVNNERYE